MNFNAPTIIARFFNQYVGGHVVIDDGGERYKHTAPRAAVAELRVTGRDRVFFFDADGVRVGWVLFVWQDAAWSEADVCDYSDYAEIRALVEC